MPPFLPKQPPGLAPHRQFYEVPCEPGVARAVRANGARPLPLEPACQFLMRFPFQAVLPLAQHEIGNGQQFPARTVPEIEVKGKPGS